MESPRERPWTDIHLLKLGIAAASRNMEDLREPDIIIYPIPELVEDRNVSHQRRASNSRFSGNNAV
jgi:hypothetical protein